jgi:hypothetical protein
MPRASYKGNHAISRREEITKIVNGKNRNQESEVEPQFFIMCFSFYISGTRVEYEY